MSIQADLWQLIRDEFVEEEYFIEGKTEPAFLISCTQIQPDKWQLLLNSIGVVGTFKTRKKARDELKRIIETANIPVKVYGKTKHRKKLKFFAENTVTRLIPKDNVPFKVFNVAFEPEAKNE